MSTSIALYIYIDSFSAEQRFGFVVLITLVAIGIGRRRFGERNERLIESRAGAQLPRGRRDCRRLRRIVQF
jgi:hypothetical protein